MLANPVIEVAGAQLRPWASSDAPRLIEAWTDADIARWNGVPADTTLGAGERWISGVAARLAGRLSVDWVIETPQLGVIGEVGLSGFSEAHSGALIGYWLLPQARGKGLAAKSVRACTEWAHNDLALDSIIARCDPANSASHAVANAAGYRLEATDKSGEQLWRSQRF